MGRDLGVILVLAAAIAAVYGQTGFHDFINYDDPAYVTENPRVQRGLTWENVVWAFTTTEQYNWHPLTWLSHALDCELFGLRPGGHHLHSLLLHVFNSALLYLVLKRMTAAPWRSAAVAALFALHPLHVESVAWVAERKDVLSTLFWMLMLGAYAWYAARPGFWRYLPVIVFLALGLMSKPMLVTAPFLLLLLDYWPLGRWRWEVRAVWLVLEKVPLFILMIISSVVTFIAQQRGGAMVPVDILPFTRRLEGALIAYVAYLGKAIWPSHLAVFYPYPASVPWWQWVGAAVILTALTALAVWVGRRQRYGAVGWFWFLGTLAPVIGLVQVGQQAMADRYTYMPYVGLFVAVVWGVADFVAARRASAAAASWGWTVGLGATAAVVILGCTVVTGFQVSRWKDSATLLTHALEVTKDNDIAHNNLGIALMEQGRLVEATAHFREAIRINPNYAHAQNNLGSALLAHGRPAEAEGHYRIAIRLDTKYVDALSNISVALLRQGRFEEAGLYAQEALNVNPYYPDAHNNLAIVLQKQGRYADAIAHCREALRVNPNYADAYGTLGNVLALQGRPAEAIACYQEAIRLHPDDSISRNNMAWIMATDLDPKIRNGPQAVRLAEQTCALTQRRDPLSLDRLAAAYAEVGRFQEAVAAEKEAITLATAMGAKDLVADMEKRQRLYEAGQPFRDARLPPKASP